MNDSFTNPYQVHLIRILIVLSNNKIFQAEVMTTSTGSGNRKRQLTGLNGGYWSSSESVEKRCRRRRSENRQDVATDQQVDKVKR